jgi:hypothetical protein
LVETEIVEIVEIVEIAEIAEIAEIVMMIVEDVAVAVVDADSNVKSILS